MNKKLIAGVLCCLMMAAFFTGCGCVFGNTVETLPPKTYDIEPDIDISEYAAFVTYDKWVDTDSDNTFEFTDAGKYEGKIDGVKYSGTFSMNIKDSSNGTLNIIAVPDGETEEVTYTLKFKTSSDMTLTISDDVSAHFVAEWTTED